MGYATAIIGLGEISKKYKEALEESDKFELKAVCDKLLSNASSYDAYRDYPLYSDYLDMINEESLDLVIISTPPSSHYTLAKSVMESGIGVIVEKPTVLNLRHLTDLIALSKKREVFFDGMFHWQHANEVIKLQKLIPDETDIVSIHTVIKDPYTQKNKRTIKPAKVNLGGSWFDSGVNALSMISTLIPLQSFEPKDIKFLFDKNSNMDYFSFHFYKAAGREFSITVDWREPVSFKQTHIQTKTDTYTITHHEETIYKNKRLIFTGTKENRLNEHYRNYFKAFDMKKTKHSNMLLIHEFLLGDGRR